MIAYSIYRPWTEDPKEGQLVALDINEKVTILEGNPMQKNSGKRFNTVISLFSLKKDTVTSCFNF